MFSARFPYNRKPVFNGKTYIEFLEHNARAYYPREVYHIRDDASYHKQADVKAWFFENRHRWRTYCLPPYSPEFNAEERIRRHTRKEGTHDRYFVTLDELLGTPRKVFRGIRRRPDEIRGYLAPFS